MDRYNDRDILWDYGKKIVGRPAWNFKYQVNLFCIVFFPQYYNAFILSTL